jgi:hypothetical protein
LCTALERPATVLVFVQRGSVRPHVGAVIARCDQPRTAYSSVPARRLRFGIPQVTLNDVVPFAETARDGYRLSAHE